MGSDVEFFKDLVQERDSVAAMAEAIGIPSIASLIICKRQANRETTYFEILPKPDITPVSPRMAAQYGKIQSVQVELTDLQVKGISRAYEQSEIYGKGISYIVGGELWGDRVEGGFAADAVSGLEQPLDEGATWSLVLRRRKP